MSTLATREPAAAAKRIEFATPPVNLHQDADGYILEVEMPGVAKDGVEVTVEDGKLTLTGHRGSAEEPGHAVYRESARADYRRVFDLDPGIDAQKITAKIEQGLLTLRLQKTEAVKPRKIAVS